MGEKTKVELTQEFDLHRHQIEEMKDQVLEDAPHLFDEAPWRMLSLR